MIHNSDMIIITLFICWSIVNITIISDTYIKNISTDYDDNIPIDELNGCSVYQIVTIIYATITYFLLNGINETTLMIYNLNRIKFIVLLTMLSCGFIFAYSIYTLQNIHDKTFMNEPIYSLAILNMCIIGILLFGIPLNMYIKYLKHLEIARFRNEINNYSLLDESV